MAPFNPSAADALELIELYGIVGSVDPADSDQHIAAYLATVEAGVAEIPSETVQQDSVQLSDAVTALLSSGVQDWSGAASTVADDAESLDLDIADLYPAPPEATPVTIMTESGSGDTRASWIQTQAPPYGPADQILGASVAQIPATGEYTFTWSIGQECVSDGWGFSIALPELGLSNHYLATTGNLPPSPPSGSTLVRLLAGELAIQTVITQGPSMASDLLDTVCPWQYTLTGPVAGTLTPSS